MLMEAGGIGRKFRSEPKLKGRGEKQKKKKKVDKTSTFEAINNFLKRNAAAAI